MRRPTPEIPVSSCPSFPSSVGPATLRLVPDDHHAAVALGDVRTAGDRPTPGLRAVHGVPAPRDPVDDRGDRRHASPYPYGTVAAVPPARRSAAGVLMTWGGAIAFVSAGLAVVLGVLVGRIDSARADMVLGGAMGDDRSQALVTAAQLSALGVVVGLVLLVAGGLLRLAPRLR
jgi:hypothetical protein